MQRTTARRIYAEIGKALDDGSNEDIIVLPESVELLITDAMARNCLVDEINTSSV